MSLGIVIKAPEGLVLAAESRLTLTAQALGQPPIHVNYDNAIKLLAFNKPNTHVGVVTYGQAVIGQRTAQSFVPEFESGIDASTRLPVNEFAHAFSTFFMEQWTTVNAEDYNGPDMTFVVAGYDDKEPYGKVFSIEIPRKPEPVEQNGQPGEFGITYGGQSEVVQRLLQGYDLRLLEIIRGLDIPAEQVQTLFGALGQLGLPLPIAVMPLQDCVDLAIFFIRTTISAQNLTIGIRGVGGPIDVATITAHKGLEFVQRKQITGEFVAR